MIPLIVNFPGHSIYSTFITYDLISISVPNVIIVLIEFRVDCLGFMTYFIDCGSFDSFICYMDCIILVSECNEELRDIKHLHQILGEKNLPG